MTQPNLGEFEHLLLLAILRLGAGAFGAEIARELESRAGRAVSRGALYTSLDRLEDKGLLRWKPTAGTLERGGLPRRVRAIPRSGRRGSCRRARRSAGRGGGVASPAAGGRRVS